MKSFKTAYCTQPASRRGMFAVSSTATGCAVLLMAATSAARAQTAPAAAAPASDTIEEVVVTGIRKSIQDSIAAKKNSSSIVEVVSAEDIGKLPDNSIAESIARLPGLAAQRTAGRAQSLSIRGLGPDYTVTTFNGREQPSTSDSRSVEFDQYPSELVSQVKIFKTPDAGMSYQGIAGTADIETVKPLAYGKRAVSLGYKYEKDGQKANVPSLSDTGNRASATYIDQFMDNTLGVALGVAYNKTPYQAQARESWGYGTVPDGATIVNGNKDGVQSSYFQRLGWLGVVEFKPNDRLHMTFDGYHSNFKELQNIRRMEYPLNGAVGWTGIALTTEGPIADNRVQSGTFSNVPFVVIENYNNETHAKIDAFGLNTDFKMTDDWTLNNDISYSKAHREKLRLESTGGDGSGDPGSPLLPSTQTATFTTGVDGVSVPTITGNYSDYNTTFLTDPGGWAGGSPAHSSRAGFWDDQTVNDEIKGIRLAASRKFQGSFISGMTFGVNYADRTKDKYRMQNALYFNGTLTAGPYYEVVPEQYRRGIINTSFFGNPNGMINYDALSMFHDGFFNVIDARNDNPALVDGPTLDADYTGSWRMNEKLTTPYIKLDIESHIGSHALTGNIGVQAQHADQTAYLNVVSASHAVSQTKDGAKYTEILPSLNLSLSLADDLKLRMAAATTLSRPRMDDMAGGATYSVVGEGLPGIQFNGNTYYWQRNAGGNPQLRPWKANAYDLSLEKYFSNKAYVSAALYYKQLKRFLYQDNRIVDFTGVLLPDQTNVGDPTVYTTANANRLGVASALLNGSGGYIRGAELSGTLPGSLISNALDGFGLIVSASWTQSSVSPHGTAAPVPGLSPRVINSTLFFEKRGFSARVSNRYRGQFDGEVPTFDGSIQNREVKSESLLDAQVGYEFQEGAVKGLSLNLSGTNLTDTPFVQWNVGDPENLNQKYEKYGAVYTLSANYRF